MNSLKIILFIIHIHLQTTVTQETFKNVIQECENNVTLITDNFNYCITTHFSFLSHSMETFCNSNINYCLNDLEGHVRPCIESQKINNSIFTNQSFRKLFDDQKKSSAAVIAYSCSDKGKHLKDFFQNGLSCLYSEQVQIQLRSCNATIKSMALLLSAFKTDAICRKQCDLSRCVINSLDTCEDKTAKWFAKGNFYYSLRVTTCKDILMNE